MVDPNIIPLIYYRYNLKQKYSLTVPEFPIKTTTPPTETAFKSGET